MQNDAGTRCNFWHKTDTSGSVSVPREKNAVPVEAGHDVNKNSLQLSCNTDQKQAARTLVRAIGKCDKKDALLILSITLSDLSSDLPILITEDGLQTEGQWYSVRTPTDIEKYFQTWIEATPSRRLEALKGMCT